MNSELDHLLETQSGVVSRAQAMAHGLRPHDIRRLVRRREWVVVHPGVYVNHTGQLTARQRAWAAVLAVWPAALSHESALSLHASGPIHVAVDTDRSVAAPNGVQLHRIVDLDSKMRANTSPPCLRIEEAVLDVAAVAPDDFAAIALLADAVQSRRTTAPRVLDALSRRKRLPRRNFLASVLSDIADGSNSALEHAYLTRVERPHGLPKPQRQHRPSGQAVLRDLDYEQFGLVIELDGKQFHDDAVARDRDMERDLAAKVHDERETIRLGWGQVVPRACSTAASIGTLLRNRGWQGLRRQCRNCPDH